MNSMDIRRMNANALTPPGTSSPAYARDRGTCHALCKDQYSIFLSTQCGPQTVWNADNFAAQYVGCRGNCRR